MKKEEKTYIPFLLNGKVKICPWADYECTWDSGVTTPLTLKLDTN